MKIILATDNEPDIAMMRMGHLNADGDFVISAVDFVSYVMVHVARDMLRGIDVTVNDLLEQEEAEEQGRYELGYGDTAAH